MGKDSKIEWCDHTFNPWIGCQKVSEGCRNCYAQREFGRKPKWANCWGDPSRTERLRTTSDYWKQPLAWDKAAGKAGRRATVFCASLADVFEFAPQVSEARADLWKLIQQTPNLLWLLLTKRPENVGALLPKYDLPNNVGIGVSVEDQDMAQMRIPLLVEMKAPLNLQIVFISAEPLIASIDLQDVPMAEKLDWIICGGESGTNARPLHPAWVRSLRDQCQDAGVPFFFKSWGEWITSDYYQDNFSHVCGMDIRGNQHYPGIDVYTFWRVGRRATGRLLDGIEWNQFPEVING